MTGEQFHPSHPVWLLRCPADGCGTSVKNIQTTEHAGGETTEPRVICENGHESEIEWMQRDQDRQPFPVLVWTGVTFPNAELIQ